MNRTLKTTNQYFVYSLPAQRRVVSRNGSIWVHDMIISSFNSFGLQIDVCWVGWFGTGVYWHSHPLLNDG
jgi:hypothetical protein